MEEWLPSLGRSDMRPSVMAHPDTWVQRSTTRVVPDMLLEFRLVGAVDHLPCKLLHMYARLGQRHERTHLIQSGQFSRNFKYCRHSL